MNNLTPVEFKTQRILTTQQLAEGYETEARRISENFNANKERYVIGKHYYLVEGAELKDFKGKYGNSVVAENINKLYLWTEKGALLHAKSLGTDKAWEVYDMLVETYFRAKGDKPACIEDVLIQSLQEMKDMRQQLNEVNHHVLEAKQGINIMRDSIVINPKAEWRKYTNLILNKIGKSLNDYKVPKDEAYNALQTRGKCRPNILINNLRARALIQGMAKSKVNDLNILDVLENEPRLKEIYVTIVKEMSIKYKVA